MDVKQFGITSPKLLYIFMQSAVLVTEINDNKTETHLCGYPNYTTILVTGSVKSHQTQPDVEHVNKIAV